MSLHEKLPKDSLSVHDFYFNFQYRWNALEATCWLLPLRGIGHRIVSERRPMCCKTPNTCKLGMNIFIFNSWRPDRPREMDVREECVSPGLSVAPVVLGPEE